MSEFKECERLSKKRKITNSCEKQFKKGVNTPKNGHLKKLKKLKKRKKEEINLKEELSHPWNLQPMLFSSLKA